MLKPKIGFIDTKKPCGKIRPWAISLFTKWVAWYLQKLQVTDCEIDSAGSSDEGSLDPQKFGRDPETTLSPIFEGVLPT